MDHRGTLQYQELSPMRGFQSSVDYRLYFGLDSIRLVDSVKIVWPYQKHLILKNLISNKHYFVEEPLETTKNEEKKRNNKSLLKRSDIVIDYEHVENNFVDFDI